ncbi:MAG: DUF92 domain-containing protein [Thaumarchaeota archaeon]|nr:DUF92 domain-containing protein [Nitrososphaerota archaeon]MCL5317074.1 DUF92 domain-containing protein [Nitrososphaerota archaeon]
MPITIYELTLGLAIVTVLGAGAHRLRAIDRDGLIIGILVGFLLLLGGGWSWLFIIMLFFATSSASTRLKYSYKRSIGFGQEKGGARGWRNTVANGGVAAVVSVFTLYSNSPLLAAAFLGASATATADTLATEIGLLSKTRPRLITNLRQKVGAGTSGGVSLLGEITVISSSLMIGAIAILTGVSSMPATSTLAVSLLGGFVGSTFDSLLGASFQGVYRCTVCGTITESSTHCDTSAVKVRGINLIENNMVNLIATGIGAVVAALFAILI